MGSRASERQSDCRFRSRHKPPNRRLYQRVKNLSPDAPMVVRRAAARHRPRERQMVAAIGTLPSVFFSIFRDTPRRLRAELARALWSLKYALKSRVALLRQTLRRIASTKTCSASPYYEGTHWGMAASKEVIEGMATDFANPNAYPVDGRGVTYSYAYFSPKHLGEGQFYLMNIVAGQ